MTLIDTVDDLQAAEDHIGVLETAIAAVTAGERVRAEMPQLLDAAIENLRGIPRYCRASCAAGECDDDCGCQAHGDGPHPGWSANRRLDWIVSRYEADDSDVLRDEDGEVQGGPFLLIQRNNWGMHYATLHDTLDAARAHQDRGLTGDASGGWRAVVVVDLRDGTEYVASVHTEFEPVTQ